MSRSLTLRKRNTPPAVIDDATKSRIQSNVEWIVADRSSSMHGERIKAVNDMLASYGDHIHIAAFDHAVNLYVGKVTLETGGSTALHLALAAIAPYMPNYIVILSDGSVDSEHDARNWARELAAHAIIDTVYIGPDNASAEEFMRELAEIGCGRYKRYDMTKPQTLALTQVIQGLLPPPNTTVDL